MKPISLRVIGLAADDWTDQLMQFLRIHLPVTIQFDDHVHLVVDCPAVARQCRAANALIFRQFQHRDAGIGTGLLDQIAGPVRTGIIDHVNSLDFVPYAGQNPENTLGLAVTGDHGGDSLLRGAVRFGVHRWFFPSSTATDHSQQAETAQARSLIAVCFPWITENRCPCPAQVPLNSCPAAAKYVTRVRKSGFVPCPRLS